MNNLHRVFIAINLPEKVRNGLASFQDTILDLPARWDRAENLHITLNFLGNANDQEVCDICAVVAKVAKRHDPFDVELKRICYGPPEKFPPRMIWAVGEKSEELGSLQRDLENTLHEFSGADSEAGEGYSFSPHVTLGRIKQTELKLMEAEEIPLIDEKISRTFLVETIDVMENEMKKSGPHYTVLESAALGG